MRPKYVLCRPEGGLNDMLCQIGKCFEYCIKHNRTLIIDTENTEAFAQKFSLYFSILDERVVCGSFTEVIKDSDAGSYSYYPSIKCLKDKPTYTQDSNYAIQGVPVRFDLKKSFNEDVLIHHQCGGGSPSKKLLRALRLSFNLFETWNNIKATLPTRYIGIHSRNTDIGSTLAGISDIIKTSRLPIFLATDSVAIQNEAKATRPSIIFTSDIPDFEGRPLHHENVDALQKQQINTTSILDLMTLAFAEKVYCTTNKSGYAKLALRLNKHKFVALKLIPRCPSSARLRRQLFIQILASRARRMLGS